MKCKYCQGELETNQTLCPHCGKDNAPETDGAQKQGMDKTKLVLAICAICAVALLGVGLIMVTLFGIKGGFKPDETAGVTTTQPGETPAPTDYVPGEGVLQYQSYSASKEDALAAGDTVVATAGDAVLTNSQLQMYYWLQFYEVWNYYYSQFGAYTPYYVGLDYTQPLEDQVSLDGTMSWQQSLLDMSLNTWHRYQSLGNIAKAEGTQIPEDMQKLLDETKASLDAAAKESGLADANALLESEMGPGVTLEDYVAYMELNYLGQTYLDRLYETLEVTSADMDAYFSENEDIFADAGVTKTSGNVSDVRHILIIPEGGTQGEGAYKEYTEAEWEACLTEAQKVLDEWKAGEATEESFIQMTGKYTEDTGYADNGGLYTDVYTGSGYVEAFEAWASNTERKPGDCELVKTQFGYHIMYCIDTELCWQRYARDGYKQEYCTKLVDEAAKKAPLVVDYDKIALGVVDFGTAQ